MVEVGRDLWVHLVQTPLRNQGHLELVAQDCVQIPLHFSGTEIVSE